MHDWRYTPITRTGLKAARCKGANGKFAKCGTKGAKPI